MPGEEREFNVGLNLDVPTEVMSPGSRAQRCGTYPNADSMKDFWSTTANKDPDMGEEEAEVERESDHHDRQEEEEAITDLHLQLQQENAALRPSYSYAEQLAKESSAPPTMEAEAQSSHINGTQHEFFQICQQPYNLETTIESSGSQAVAPLGTLLPASAYINFINGTYSRLATTQQPNSANAYTDNYIVGNEQRFYSPSASTSEPNDNTTSFPNVAGHLLTQITEGMNRDMNSLRRNSVFKCPDRSSDLQSNTTAHSGEDLNVPGNGSPGSGTGSSSDELEEPPHDQEQVSHEAGAQDEMRAAIRDHPFYTEMVLSHLKILKIGAPKSLRIKVEDLSKKYQKLQDEELSTSDQPAAGNDPELDYFMKSFVGLLTTFQEEMADPFNKFMAYKDNVSKQLEDVCGHYVETGEDENETYGFEIEHLDGLDGVDEAEDMEMPEPEMLFATAGGNDNIVIDPNAPEEELKKMLQKRYGRYIGGLKAEFNRVRKKGKLPGNARRILKDWFNSHSFWPYPSEIEKANLQKLCALNMKQINNWFINERKRHWSCEGKCMHPNTKFYDTDSTSQDKEENISDS